VEEVLHAEEPDGSSGGCAGGGGGGAWAPGGEAASSSGGALESGSSGKGGGGAGAACRFNSCLLNLYEDGSRYVGWHRDDERGLGEDPEIASASFGGTRDFHLRECTAGVGGGGGGGGGRKLCVQLANGDVLVMRGALQRHWQHAVPKRARAGAARISLTFRRVATEPPGGGGGRPAAGAGVDTSGAGADAAAAVRR
jgi:hypothetical protein